MKKLHHILIVAMVLGVLSSILFPTVAASPYYTQISLGDTDVYAVP